MQAQLASMTEKENFACDALQQLSMAATLIDKMSNTEPSKYIWLRIAHFQYMLIAPYHIISIHELLPIPKENIAYRTEQMSEIWLMCVERVRKNLMMPKWMKQQTCVYLVFSRRR